MEKRSFKYKSKGGIGSRKYQTSQKRVEYWWENKSSGSENSGSLFR